MNAKKVFWNWFVNQTMLPTGVTGMSAKQIKQLVVWMAFHLQHYCDGLGYVIQFSTAAAPVNRLVITAHGDASKFDMVRALVKDAPCIPHWTIGALVQPVFDLETLLDGLDAPYNFRDFSIKASALRFSVLGGDEASRKLDIVIYLDDYPSGLSKRLLNVLVYGVVQELLGEQLVTEHLNYVEIKPMPAYPTDLIYLYDLPLFLETAWD